jgi:2-polyprenyl-6-methoxyphenol hydroxylase-like FAD-dependent oxidoreductase
LRVLVVGAGVGGLTLAALLRRADGIEVEIVERAPALRPDGFGLLLYPFGSRVLRELGCWKALLDSGCALATMSLRDGRGAVVEDYDLGELTARAGPASGAR